MSGGRIWQKNDLFNLSYQLNKESEAKLNKKKTKVHANVTKQHIQLQEQVQRQFEQLDAAKALKIQQCNQQKGDIDDQLRNIFQEINHNCKKQQKQAQNSTVRAKIKYPCFTPKRMKKQCGLTPQTKQKLTYKQQQKAQFKQKMEMIKMRKDLKKTIENQQDNAKVQVQENLNDEPQVKNKVNSEQIEKKQKQQQSFSESKQKKTKTAKSKKKKIKKQENLVRQNLKRKYKDRFVGKLGQNIRNIQQIKKQKRYGYYKPQIQITQGQLYNTYTNSLSKALFYTFSIDEDEQQFQEQTKLQYTIPSSYDKSSLQKLIKQLFGFNSFRQGQFQTINNILNNKSTLFVSQTASGKSMTYILSSVIMKGLGIVISPLVSLMLDQLQHLPSDLPAACLSSLLNYQQKKRIINMVKNGKIQLLFVTPETFLTEFMFHIKQFPAINFVCVDEAHSLSQLSHSFRASYLCLQQIILKYFKYRSQKPVVLCLTATANQQTIDSVTQKLKIQSVIKSKTTINKNLFITVSREQGHAKYQATLNYLRDKTISKLKGVLIYCRTKKIMFQAYNYLRNSSVGCHIYHSGLEQKQKVEVMGKFRQGKIRIVIATIALGMGLDFGNLECVIHINMPKSIQNYIQQIGRAGRRERRAYCHLFLDKNDYYVQRNYFLADQLQFTAFSKLIFELKKRTNRNSQEIKKVAKKNRDQFKRQTQKLKRLSISNPDSDQKQNPNHQIDIYYESEEQKQSVHESLKLDSNAIINNNEDNFEQLSYCKSAHLTDIIDMSQESILNIFLKIQRVMGKDHFKVLPLSHETVKIGFFKNNRKQLEQKSQIFVKMVENAKNFKGMLYVPLIQKCNLFNMTPIQLLAEIYSLSNTFSLKIELINEIFVWKTSQTSLRQLDQKEMINKILEQFNKVQRTALTKFNIFYSVCFSNAKKQLAAMLKNRQIISHKQQLPPKQIINDFDKYFKEDTYDFYKQIVLQASAGLSNNDDDEAAYLPLTQINEDCQIDINNSVSLFMKHMLNSCDKCFNQIVAQYRDGRIITRVFMGVNDSKSNWKIYGEHTYWMRFKDKDYRKLLKIVKQAVMKFIIRQGPIYLQLEKKEGKGQSRKKIKDEKQLQHISQQVG